MSKPSDLHFEFACGCLIVRARGRGLVVRKEASAKAIADASKSHPVKAVLVDMRHIPGPYTFLDRYQLGEVTARYLAHLPVGALVLEKQLDPGRIGQVVATNRGAKLEVFTDPAAAERWLGKFRPTPPGDPGGEFGRPGRGDYPALAACSPIQRTCSVSPS